MDRETVLELEIFIEIILNIKSKHRDTERGIKKGERES